MLYDECAAIHQSRQRSLSDGIDLINLLVNNEQYVSERHTRIPESFGVLNHLSKFDTVHADRKKGAIIIIYYFNRVSHNHKLGAACRLNSI